MSRTFWTFIALLMVAAANCGTGTDGQPVAPPTTPQAAPAPAPEPPTPTVRAVVWVLSSPSDPNGYYTGEKIRVIADFTEAVSVVDSPRLGIQIGEHRRLADFYPWIEDNWSPERPSLGQRFEYEVGPDDADADGITIPRDPFDFAEGALLNRAGVEIEVQITAIGPEHSPPNPRSPGAALASHRVVGMPEPRVCTDERELARAFGSVLLDEWDGTPFRFHFDTGIPETDREDAEHMFWLIDRLADRIEQQLGYSVIEVGGWVTCGWASPGNLPFEVASNEVCRARPKGGIVAGVVMENMGAFARAHNGTFFWSDNNLYGSPDHELFHVFGFDHHPCFPVYGYGGVEMSEKLTCGGPRERDLNATDVIAHFKDIDALGCVFPHPDLPR